MQLRYGLLAELVAAPGEGDALRGLVRRPVAWAARGARMALRQRLVVMVLLR